LRTENKMLHARVNELTQTAEENERRYNKAERDGDRRGEQVVRERDEAREENKKLKKDIEEVLKVHHRKKEIHHKQMAELKRK
jgi:hypothetical protein